MIADGRRIRARLDELAKQRCREYTPCGAAAYFIDSDCEPGRYPPANADWQPFDRPQIVAAGQGLWVQLQLTAAPIPGRLRVLDLQWQSPVEGMLFWRGRPYVGLKGSSLQLLIPDESRAGKYVQLRINRARMDSGAISLQRAGVYHCDVVINDLYYTAAALAETALQLAPEDPARLPLLAMFDEAMLQLCWAEPNDRNFRNQAQTALQLIQARWDALAVPAAAKVTIVGFTPQPVGAEGPLSRTRETCARATAAALRLAGEYPEYTYLHSQIGLLLWLKADYPELFQEMRSKVKDGSIEIGGGFWVEPYGPILSGEAWVRQILHSARFLDEEFGIHSSFAWLPGTGGLSGTLPGIFVQAGIEQVFMGSFPDCTRLPDDSFIWKGSDGTEIYAHVLPSIPQEDGGVPAAQWLPEKLNALWKSYKNRCSNDALILPWQPSEQRPTHSGVLEMSRRFGPLPALVKTRRGPVKPYLSKFHSRMKQARVGPGQWVGELYPESGQGSYTRQAALKRGNRQLELALRRQEWIQVLRSVVQGDWRTYPSAWLEQLWRQFLTQQAYHVLSGAASADVTRQVCREQMDMLAQLKAAESDVAAAVCEEQDGFSYTIFNASSWSNSEVVELPMRPGMERGIWEDDRGRRLKAAASDKGWIVLVPEVPALGWAVISFSPRETPGEEGPFTLHSDGIETPFFILRWNKSGQWVRLYDRTCGRELLQGGRGNVLQVFEDRPLSQDSGDLDRNEWVKREEISDLISAEVVEHNGLRCVIRFCWQWQQSRISQDLVVYSHSRRMDLVTDLDWQQRRQFLRAAFVTDLRSAEARFDSAYGSTVRPAHANTSWDQAKTESVGHQWVDLSEEGYGISLLNDGRYGFSVFQGTLRISLLKGPQPGEHSFDLGTHRLTYALFPHNGRVLNSSAVAEAWSLNQPLLAVPGRPYRSRFSLAVVEGGQVMVDAVKASEDGETIILRFHEYGGKWCKIRVSLNLPVTFWQQCNVLEEETGPAHQGPLELTFTPFSLQTIKVVQSR